MSADPRSWCVRTMSEKHPSCTCALADSAPCVPLTDGLLRSIQAWTQGLSNVEPAKHLDAAGEWAGFEAGRYDVVMVANMCHISPWACTTGLCRGALCVASFCARAAILRQIAACLQK